MDNIIKLKRTTQLITVLSKYGFETLISLTEVKKLIPNNLISKDKGKETYTLSIYERIRMVLEELGPAYIKFGQLLSNRDDILPEELTIELQKLQDQVTIKDIDICKTLQEELAIDLDEIFSTIDTQAIAAASLSQVYTATLKKDNQNVVIKVKKKDALKTVKADILIMKDFASILEKYYDNAKKIGLTNIIFVFEKSIMSELSFIQELENIERFRKNFQGNTSIYVPATYKQFSNSNVLCMELIDGIKISDKEKIREAGLDAKIIASKVVDLYLKQIIDYGFFHADPHSGNIFVLPTGQIAFIDYGSVGIMLPQDKEDLGDFIIYALRKDTKRLIRIIKKIAIKYNIGNESQLERDLYFFLDMLDRSSIHELDMNEITKLFGRFLNENHIVLPDYIYLLARGIVLLEGIGRELEIETNIIENVRPYTIKLVKERLKPKYIANKVINKLYDLGDQLQELPEDAHSLVQKINNNELEINHRIRGLTDIKTTINRIAIAIITSALAIGSSILIHAKMPPVAWDISIIGFMGFLISGGFASILIISILRDKN